MCTNLAAIKQATKPTELQMCKYEAERRMEIIAYWQQN
jgi:hypothetical protein